MKIGAITARMAGAFALLVTAQLAPTQAAAQNALSLQNRMALQRAAVELYNTCMATDGSEGAEAACACVTGYMAGAMTDREFDIVARLGRIGTLIEEGQPENVVQAEIAAFFQAGYTQGEADAVSAKMSAMTARGDAVCAPFGPNVSA